MPIDKAERRYDVKDAFVKLQKIQVQTPLQKQAIGNMRRRSVRIACRPPRQLVTDSTNESSDSEAHVQSKKRRPQLAPVNAVATRKSLRLQRLDPVEAPVPEQQDFEEEKTLNQSGPIEMVPVNLGANGRLPQSFLDCWNESSLIGMTLQEDHVAKVVKNHIFSVAVHPCTSTVLVAAGDKWGRVGLWDVNSDYGDDGVYLFEPHSRPVCCMYFSASHPAHLLTLSYDGTIRCADVNKAIFDDVYQREEPLSCFDFLSKDGSTLIAGACNGNVMVVDRRAQSMSHELLTELDIMVIRTVHVHPVDNNYFMVAGKRSVCIYDARCLKPKGSRSVASLQGHTKTVNSAYFSPLSGNRVLTTCMDDRLRHNNNTGCWLTKFRAVWNPTLEDCFVVGSMAQPRQIEIFHESGSLLHTFRGDCLGSVCSINAFHPSRSVLVAGRIFHSLHRMAIYYKLRHNNNTGCWLTKFRAVWNPTLEDCFVVGSMAQPRQIEMFHESGSLLHTFRGDCLGSVCSINAFHPSRSVLVAGNSSGRLHVFMG
ncbi:WD repeat-containing protein 76 [Acipenser ruthenus]|uniref:WD repeat-containing protein 76 n=1 Tax=Acipenser ruthenus TaxID=7906 RepID=A0A444V4H3_ACIRT|nr:WD repeat-containing protein 76 [Acipenser ruthenus]